MNVKDRNNWYAKNYINYIKYILIVRDKSQLVISTMWFWS